MLVSITLCAVRPSSPPFVTEVVVDKVRSKVKQGACSVFVFKLPVRNGVDKPKKTKCSKVRNLSEPPELPRLLYSRSTIRSQFVWIGSLKRINFLLLLLFIFSLLCVVISRGGGILQANQPII